MENYFQNKKFLITDEYMTAFSHENGVHQDGTTPAFRDVDGKLWAISGHSHVAEIVMFCGTNMRNMKKMYPIKTNFMLTRITEKLIGEKEYMNPYWAGHYNARGLEEIGRKAGEGLAKIINKNRSI